MTIYFIKKLRQEKKFDSADTLIAQITKVVVEGTTVLAKNPTCVT